MIKGSNTLLTLENVLNKVTEGEIFRHFLGFDYRIKQLYYSPIITRGKQDTCPSFNIFPDSKGKLKFKDFGDSSGDVFDFVCDLKLIPRNLYKALEIINYEMNLGLGSFYSNNINAPIKRYKGYDKQFKSVENELVIKDRKPSINDINYWRRGRISPSTLGKFKVVATEEIWVKKEHSMILIWKHSIDNPIYSYVVNKKIKGYRPLAKDRKDKWISKLTADDIQGLEQLQYRHDFLFITKSLKDVMVLDELGFDAIAPNSENGNISDDLIHFLKSKYKHIIIFFDNDEPGVKASVKLTSSTNSHYINIPKHYLILYGIKDSFDMVEFFGQNFLLYFLTNSLKKLNIYV